MTVTAWDQPAGAVARGTLVLLPGRGETPASYERFGRRISADGYQVRLVPVDLEDLEATRESVEKVLADESLPSPKVLVGADSGATFAVQLGDRLPVDAVVAAGIALPESTGAGSWEAEVEARTACPVHRRVIGEDSAFARGGLDAPLPWPSVEIADSGVPLLLVHGTADVITPSSAALASVGPSARVRVRFVNGGRHDVLNDVSHRSVAATIVLFLESLKLGPDLPEVVTPVGASAP